MVWWSAPTILAMRIEKLSSKPDRAGRYYLTFDDGQVLRLYRQTVEDYGLYAGLELDDAQTERLRQDAGAVSAKMRAVRIVAASNVSKKDLCQRLVQKGEDPTQAQQAVDWMESLNLVDDRETARQVVSRSAAKGYGLQRAKQALYEKKIPKAFWDDALADYPDQSEHILSFLRARLGKEPQDREVKRAVDALLRRGHSYGEIRKALEKLSLEAEDFSEE